MSEFLNRLQKHYETNLKNFQLIDQKVMFDFLVSPIAFELTFGIPTTFAFDRPRLSSAKLLPTNTKEFRSVYSPIIKNNMEKEYDKFIDLIRNVYWPSSTRFAMIDFLEAEKMSDSLRLFLNLLNQNERNTFYLTKNATWQEFTNFFKSITEQIYIKNEKLFSKNFFNIYNKFLDKYFKKFGPKEEIDFRSINPRYFRSFTPQRTLQNYQNLLEFKNLINEEKESYYWNIDDKVPCKQNLENFDLIIASRTKKTSTIESMKSIIIYLDGKVYEFGYASNWGLNKNYSNFLKKYSLSYLMTYEGVLELQAFFKK